MPKSHLSAVDDGPEPEPLRVVERTDPLDRLEMETLAQIEHLGYALRVAEFAASDDRLPPARRALWSRSAYDCRESLRQTGQLPH